MYTRIVVGIDGSELANKALRHALVLARENKAKLFVVTATEPSVMIAPGATEVVAYAQGSRPSVPIAIEEWDYLWTDDPTECM